MDDKKPTPEEIIAGKNDLIAAYEERMAGLEKKVDVLLKLVGNNEASEPADKKSKPVIPAEAVTIGDKKYMFKFPTFFFNTKHHEAQDAFLDSKLLKEIIAVPGQGILAEIF